MKDFELDFYSHLGVLSVKFAQVEYNLSVILGQLIGNNYDLIVLLLIENNSLSQNIELLKKINKGRWYNEKKISDLISQVNSIKNDRNLFIHGIWGVPYVANNEIKIVCDERKIHYSDQKDINGNIITKTWAQNKNHIINLTYIKIKINKIEEILKTQNSIIELLGNVKFI